MMAVFGLKYTISFAAIIVHQKGIGSIYLITILQAYLLNPKFINDSQGYNVSTKLSFPRQWGLGTSSTLINNIAQWTVNAFTLLDTSFEAAAMILHVPKTIHLLFIK
jgi:hypothetical protein